jgi:membrane protease YdiL (CAAX protease family)
LAPCPSSNAGLESTSASRWSRILPDFGALLPTTMRERLLFAVVALSAGLCEEVVFRAWLLNALHELGLSELVLVGTASAVFGLAHHYQGVIGIVVTGLLAVVFCGLYFASGTLWVPIVIHAIIDVRVAVMPSTYLGHRPATTNALDDSARQTA